MLKCKECGSLIGKKLPDIFWFPDQRKIVTIFGELVLKGGLEFSIFNYLWANQAVCGLTGEILIERLCYSFKSGGYSLSALRQRIHHLRKQIAPIGLAITKGNGSGSGYNLILVEPKNVVLDMKRAKVA